MVSSAAQKTGPASTVGPRGCRANLSEVDDAEIAAAASQGPEEIRVFVGARRMTPPSAVTTSAASRLSTASPYLRMSNPRPPPRVNPATPVWLMMPPVVARPWSCVAWSTSPQQGAALHPGRATGGIDRHGAHRREVDDEPPVADGGAGDVVAAAS